MATQIGGLGGYNPGALSNDFMAQQLFAQQAAAAQQQPAILNGAGLQQPQADTFQRQGGSGLGSGLALGAVAGAGTTAATYFMSKGPVEEGKFAESILKAAEENPEKIATDKATQVIETAQTKILNKHGIKNAETFKAIKEFATAKSPDITKLPEETQKLLKEAGIKNQDQAILKYTKAGKGLANIKIDKIIEKYLTEAKAETLAAKTENLKKLQAQEAKIKGLAKDADLEKFFTENAKEFGLTGDEAAIKSGAKKLAEKYKNPEDAAKAYETLVKNADEAVKTKKAALNSKVAGYYDEGAKALKQDAPEEVAKAFKNFKFNKAAKFGAIAAGAGLVLGWMFGGSSK